MSLRENWLGPIVAPILVLFFFTTLIGCRQRKAITVDGKFEILKKILELTDVHIALVKNVEKIELIDFKFEVKKLHFFEKNTYMDALRLGALNENEPSTFNTEWEQGYREGWVKALLEISSEKTFLLTWTSFSTDRADFIIGHRSGFYSCLLELQKLQRNRSIEVIVSELNDRVELLLLALGFELPLDLETSMKRLLDNNNFSAEN